MGVYFAATGFGNKLAATVGEASQMEKYEGKITVSKEVFNPFTEKGKYEVAGVEQKDEDYPMNQDLNVEFKTNIYLSGEEIVFEDFTSNKSIGHLFELDKKSLKAMDAELTEFKATKASPMHAKLLFEKDAEAAKIDENKGDGKDYGISFSTEEAQNAQEYKIFMWITIFTVAFGLLLIVFLKKLKKLTHGAEDNEGTHHEEADGFELADGDLLDKPEV